MKRKPSIKQKLKNLKRRSKPSKFPRYEGFVNITDILKDKLLKESDPSPVGPEPSGNQGSLFGANGERYLPMIAVCFVLHSSIHTYNHLQK